MNRAWKYLIIWVTTVCLGCGSKLQNNQSIDWIGYNQTAFNLAKKENKLVLLDVGANWCHWCHVMDDSTYENKAVTAYINENFIACKEDQDERPDLYSAYRKWGWPATIILDHEGNELVRLKGYQQRDKFLKILHNTIKNPVKIEDRKENRNEHFEEIDIIELKDKLKKSLDFVNGGYISNNKSIEENAIQFALQQAKNDSDLRVWANKSIDSSFTLIDPVWGGVYQYSARGSWFHPHFEKLLKYQATYISTYTSYFWETKDSTALDYAIATYEYCHRFLESESGLYFNSQNADLIPGIHAGDYYELNEEARLAKGLPSIDQSLYLKENASFAIALAKLWAATGNDKYFEKGAIIINYILKNFKAKNGLFKRSKDQAGIFSFEDNRQFIEALLVYYQIDQQSNYLKAAEELGENLIKNFYKNNQFISVVGDKVIRSTTVDFDNLSAVKTFYQLGYIGGKANFIAFSKSHFSQLNYSNLIRIKAAIPLLITTHNQMSHEPFKAMLIQDEEESISVDPYLKRILLSSNLNVYFQSIKPSEMNEMDRSFYGDFKPGTLFMCTSSYCSAPQNSLSMLDDFILLENR